MRHWFSPLPLNQALVTLLSEAELEPWPTEQGSTPAAPCLLVYDRPDRLIPAAAAADAALTLQQIAEGYSQLLHCAETTGQPLLAGWRLERYDSPTLQQWLTDGSQPAAITAPTVAIPPLLAAAILGLLEVQPELLDAYSDLELRAELFGDEPDLHHRQLLRQRLQQADPMADLLATFQTPAIVHDLEQELQARDTELGEAREEAELTLLQLHQVQEELEQIFLADRQKEQDLEQLRQTSDAELSEAREAREEAERLTNQLQPRVQELGQQLHARDAELSEAREAREEAERLTNQLQPRVQELEQQLHARDTELSEAREEAELTLLQLHQVQEELEHYFLLSRGQNELLNQYDEQQLRVQQLLGRLITGAEAPAVAPQR